MHAMLTMEASSRTCGQTPLTERATLIGTSMHSVIAARLLASSDCAPFGQVPLLPAPVGDEFVLYKFISIQLTGSCINNFTFVIRNKWKIELKQKEIRIIKTNSWNLIKNGISLVDISYYFSCQGGIPPNDRIQFWKQSRLLPPSKVFS